MIRVADYIMQRIAEQNVRHLFMVTGRGILYLTDAAAKQERLQCVSVHHEQAGAYAAMAYAQLNGTLGACLVSTGCAGTNAMTGVLCAWQDEVPCLFVSGQNTLKETVRYTGLPIRTYGQQEADIISLVSPITKYAVMIEDPLKIAYELDKALYLAQNGRKGPVWIDVPLDVQNMRVEPETLERFVPEEENVFPAEEDVSFVAETLRKAKRPVILIGNGVRSAGAVEDLKSFALSYKLPVVYANSAVDIFTSDNALSLGTVSSMAANRAANFAVQNADFVLVLGNRLTSMTVGNDPEKFAREAVVAVVDIDPTEHEKKTVNISRMIKADVKAFLQALKKEKFSETSLAWQNKCLHWKEIFPKCEDLRKEGEKIDLYYLADELSKYLDPEAVFVCDAGLEELIMPTTISFRKGQRCLHPVCQGAMGYALPASIGAYLSGGRQTVAVIGDGSVMMNIQELQTIAYHRYPVKILIADNDCYAVIRNRQIDLFRTRTIGTDETNGVSCPDFEKVAEAFGIRYEKIEQAEQMSEILPKVLAAGDPVICEIITTPKQTFLHSSFARSVSGKFVQRPLEDQSPFLPRDVFLSEMIVEPIDQ